MKLNMNRRKIITGIKNYDISELKNILENYVYNKHDNNYNNIPVYKITDIEILPGEMFEKYPKNINIACWNYRNFIKNYDKIIEVSNLGRIKIDGILQEQKEMTYGYLYINLNNKTNYNVYRMVGETWCPCPVEETNKYWQVHHITNNGYDNRAENLIWVNLVEHRFIDPFPYKRTNILKNNLFSTFENMVKSNSDNSEIEEIIKDIILLGKKHDKEKIEYCLSKINFDLSHLKDILWNNVGIKI
jgi:hypothetical protein